MRVGMISHWYDPEGGAAAGPGTIARAIARRGHQVDVVTGFPIYPTGEIFDGYRIRPYQVEHMQGVTVHRCPIYPSHDSRALHRIANYTSFAISGSIIAARVLRSCDVVFIYSSPATAAIPGELLRVLRGVPVVLQIQDLWPDTVLDSGFVGSTRPKYIDRTLHWVSNLTYRNADTVAVTSPSMAGILQSRGISPARLTYLPNWADEGSFYPTAADPYIKQALGLTRPFVAMYAGNIGEMQALENVIDAARLLADRADIEIALVGGGIAEDRLRRQVSEFGISNVHFVPPQPFSSMAKVLAVGDVQLITLKDVALYRATIPSKLQASLAAGRPIITNVRGDGASIVQAANAGRVCSPGSATALAESIREFADIPSPELTRIGRHGRKHYLTTFSEQVIGDQLVDAILIAAEGKGRRIRG